MVVVARSNRIRMVIATTTLQCEHKQCWPPYANIGWCD